MVLTGIHQGYYGLDMKPPQGLLDLLVAVEEGRLVKRLRLGSIEPTEITPPLIGFLASSQIVCPYLHIPLQSGHNRVLAGMNRSYTTSRFREVIESLVAAIPDICIGCDVIAGFPGETGEEFEETVNSIGSLPVAYLHVFPFSARPGTLAAVLPGHVHGECSELIICPVL